MSNLNKNLDQDLKKDEKSRNLPGQTFQGQNLQGQNLQGQSYQSQNLQGQQFLNEQTTVHQVRAPVLVENIARPAVVQETIHPIEKEEIQPIIHREREQTEIHRATEHLHESVVQPTLVQQRELPAEFRAVQGQRSVVPEMAAPRGMVNIDSTQHTQVVHQPIVEETIHKTIIEEVQPVLHRDVIAPTLIKEVQPIYEKVVEATVVLPPQDLGMRELGTKNVDYSGSGQYQYTQGTQYTQGSQSTQGTQYTQGGQYVQGTQYMQGTQFTEGTSGLGTRELGTKEYSSTQKGQAPLNPLPNQDVSGSKRV